MKIILSKKDIERNVETICRLVDCIDPIIGGSGEKPDYAECVETLMSMNNNIVKVRPTFFGGVALVFNEEYMQEFNNVALETIIAAAPHAIALFKTLMTQKSAWEKFVGKWF